MRQNCYKVALRIITENSATGREQVLALLMEIIRVEVQHVPDFLHNVLTPGSLKEFSWNMLLTELKEKMPFLHGTLVASLTTRCGQYKADQ